MCSSITVSQLKNELIQIGFAKENMALYLIYLL